MLALMSNIIHVTEVRLCWGLSASNPSQVQGQPSLTLICFKAAATYFRLGSALSTGSIMVGSWLNSTTCSATASPHSSPSSLGAAGMSRLQEQVQGQTVSSKTCQAHGAAGASILLHRQAA